MDKEFVSELLEKLYKEKRELQSGCQTRDKQIKDLELELTKKDKKIKELSENAKEKTPAKIAASKKPKSELTTVGIWMLGAILFMMVLKNIVG